MTIDPATKSTPLPANGAARIFGPGRSASTATTDTGALGGLADRVKPTDVVGERAVAEVEANDVDARDQHLVEHVWPVGRRTQRGHDLRSGAHT